MSAPFRAVVCGVRGMGLSHARLLASHPDFRLAGVCDLDAAVVGACADALAVPFWTDWARLLDEVRPEVAVICTPNASHADLTLQTARAGVRAVLCEKPMATNLGQAREMVAECARLGVELVIHHQRRVGRDLVRARGLIEAGAIGDVLEWRGWCAGDILSDGTHAVDSLLFLAGDAPVKRVAGLIHRDAGRPVRGSERPGYRHGHPVESAGWGLIEFDDGRRMEIFCGDFRGRTAYQEYEVTGTRGRLWRVGDALAPNLFIQDADGGPLQAGFDAQKWHAVPVPASGGRGLWRAVPDAAAGGAIPEAYRRLALTLRTGEPHPMSGAVALKGFEVLMAIYESARQGRPVDLPLAQEAFPLELMMSEGRA